MNAEYDRVGFPIVPLVKQLARLCDRESARCVHWGATTQENVDTGMILQVRDDFNLLAWDLDAVIASLMHVTIDHGHTVMLGRNIKKHAAPITFGVNTAVWLDRPSTIGSDTRRLGVTRPLAVERWVTCRR